MLDTRAFNEALGGRTLASVSRETGLCYTQVHGIASGKVTNVRMSTLDKLARALGVSPKALVK